jgi:DEAD/DEAH box helicase domain-containing protein
VLAKHLPAAAFELPLKTELSLATASPERPDASLEQKGNVSDLDRFGPLAPPIVGALNDQGIIVEVKQQYYFSGGQNPAVGVSLRHMSDNTFSIVLLEGGSGRAGGGRRAALMTDLETDHTVIANVDAISAPELVYPEAVYLHNGETYLVRELDLAGKVAYVERRETDYYTQAVLESNVRITGERETNREFPRALLGYGDVDVAWQTVAFKKIKFATRENIGLGPVDIPAQNLQTTAVWLAPDDAMRAEMKAAGVRASEGVVGLRNLAVVALPLVAMCDSRDLGGVVDSKNLGHTTMIVYDRYPGGLGYSERGFANMPQLLAICLEMVRDCPCEDGCPSCVGLPNLRPAIHSDPDLMRGHPMPSKQATIRLLELLTSAGDSADGLRQTSPASAVDAIA